MISYMNECELQIEQTKMYSEEDYPFLVNRIMEHIDNVKKVEKDMPLVDIIVDFGLKNSISLELIGDAISNDVYFKEFIRTDTIYNRTKNDDW